MRVEATISMPTPSIAHIDRVRVEFVRAMTVARASGRFESFTRQIARGQVGMTTAMWDDYKADGVLCEWFSDSLPNPK